MPSTTSEADILVSPINLGMTLQMERSLGFRYSQENEFSSSGKIIQRNGILLAMQGLDMSTNISLRYFYRNDCTKLKGRSNSRQ